MRKLFILVLFLFTVNNVFCQTVYITKTGEKYHDKSCSYLRRSSITITFKEAVERGYEACKVCKPIAIQNKLSQIKNGEENVVEKQSENSTVQCSGTTKKGARCKRMTTNSNGRCYQH